MHSWQVSRLSIDRTPVARESAVYRDDAIQRHSHADGPFEKVASRGMLPMSAKGQRPRRLSVSEKSRSQADLTKTSAMAPLGPGSQ